MISLVSAPDVLTAAHRFLGVFDDGTTSESYLAAVLRRLAGATCPCSPKTLVRAMTEAHRGLVSNPDSFQQQVEETIDALVAIGDLLELNDVTAVDENIKGTWLFAAPPGFVIHLGDAANIIGLTRDEQTPLPAAVRDRVVIRGVSRKIYPAEGEDLRALLNALGLREVSSASWLRHPKNLSSKELVDRADLRLTSSGSGVDLEDLRVFNHNSERAGYRVRWENAKGKSGRFVIRRAQAYGADRWGYAELANGDVIKLLEFPEPEERWRGCDIAWRLMLALQSLQGRPVTYRVNIRDDMAGFDLFHPIPDWATRALIFAGQKVPARSCLLSFDVPISEMPATEQFLATFLFLTRAAN